MHRSDVARVARMHEQLFPVRYDDRFYASLLSVHAVTLLAFLECDDGCEKGGDAMAAAARVPGSGTSDRSDLLQSAADPSSERRLILVGLATGRCREESSTCRRSHSGYITTLGVDSRFRRLGLGKFLIKHLVRLLRELDPRIEQVTLDVLESNDAAVGLYKSAGFKVLQRLEEHYQFPPPNDTRLHHALQMVKYLDKRKSIYDDDDDREDEHARKQGWGCAVM
jgi:ribosomal protein S18 acetylase RimI-like enzyme